ncbi:Dyp-type peroxidase, partial [Escherichia coli]|nr:Dyp-type peroxidase [Escherichia coli]
PTPPFLERDGGAGGGGRWPVAHAQKTQSAPGTLSPDARNEKQPFYGEHQAGILTPQQAAMMLVAFDVLASDKADLERLFRLLTQRFAFLTQGGAAPETPNPRLPPLDSGILGGYIAPDNLTLPLSVGHTLFDDPFVLAPPTPKKLQKMKPFPTTPREARLTPG